jgi:hypothetical protein
VRIEHAVAVRGAHRERVRDRARHGREHGLAARARSAERKFLPAALGAFDRRSEALVAAIAIAALISELVLGQ